MFMSPSGFLKKSKNLRGKGAAELDMDAWDMPSEDVWRGTGCYALHAKRQKNDEETDHSLWNQLDLQENLQEKWCIVNPCNNGPVSCGLSQQPGEMPVGPRWGQGWQTCRRWTRSEAASKLFVLRLPSWLRKPMVWGIGGLSNSQKHQLILACFFLTTDQSKRSLILQHVTVPKRIKSHTFNQGKWVCVRIINPQVLDGTKNDHRPIGISGSKTKTSSAAGRAAPSPRLKELGLKPLVALDSPYLATSGNTRLHRLDSPLLSWQ